MANAMAHAHEPHLAIYYEHPEWFIPLFAEHDRRGVAYDRLLAHEHAFDPAERTSPYALIVNRMSPSAFKRGHTQAIFGTLPYLAYLKEIGANVLNGYDVYVYEFSKARQLGLFERLRAYPNNPLCHNSMALQCHRGKRIQVTRAHLSPCEEHTAAARVWDHLMFAYHAAISWLIR